MKCSEENVILRKIFHVGFRSSLHFMLYRGNVDYFLDSGAWLGFPGENIPHCSGEEVLYLHRLGRVLYILNNYSEPSAICC